MRRRAKTEASRHHQAALNLIGDYPNVWLDGLLHVDVSAAAMVAGDLHGSLEHAQAALDSAEVSGHSRTKLAALINIAQVLAMKGGPSWRSDILSTQRSKLAGNQHLVRASLDALANLWITRGDLEEAGKGFFPGRTGIRVHRPIAELGCNQRAKFSLETRTASAAPAPSAGLPRASTRNREGRNDGGWLWRISIVSAKCLAMSGKIPSKPSALCR